MKLHKNILIYATLALLGLGGAYWIGYNANPSNNEELKAQLKDLTEKEKRSAIERSISSQMQEIAYQQKDISDRQREEAVQQTRIANEMRQQAEVERRNAQEAERNALESEHKAVEASHLAESQRELAEQQREEAVFARSVADTLNYLTLARSLASEAVMQENINNHELATLLAYTSYIFTERFNGDVYNSGLFDAMSLTSRANQTWKVLNGAAMKIEQYESDETRYLCISTYGELYEFRYQNGELTPKLLFSNKDYDLRDFQLFPNGMIYVVSRSGELLMFNPNGSFISLPIPNAIHPFRLFSRNNTELIVVAENGVFIIEQGNLKLDQTVLVDNPINIVGRRGRDLMLFNKTNVVQVLNMDDLSMKTETLPFSEQVYSYNSIQQYGMQIYGTIDGVTIIEDKEGKLNRLVGHQSRVSRISWVYKNLNRRIQENMIITSSYDGTIKLWDWQTNRIEPINVFNSDTWVVCYRFENSGNYIWSGGQNGTLSRTILSIPLMAEEIKKSLKRDFTPEEWAYYIGNNIPYESFIGK